MTKMMDTFIKTVLKLINFVIHSFMDHNAVLRVLRTGHSKHFGPPLCPT